MAYNKRFTYSTIIFRSITNNTENVYIFFPHSNREGKLYSPIGFFCIYFFSIHHNLFFWKNYFFTFRTLIEIICHIIIKFYKIIHFSKIQIKLVFIKFNKFS